MPWIIITTIIRTSCLLWIPRSAYELSWLVLQSNPSTTASLRTAVSYRCRDWDDRAEENYVHYRGVLWHYFILFYVIDFFFCVEMFMNILCFSGAFARAKRAQRSPIAIENGNNRLQKIWLWRQRTSYVVHIDSREGVNHSIGRRRESQT